MIEIYTDGACLGNPGPGGWAAIILINGNQKVISGQSVKTTNNRMELTASIKSLEYFKSKKKICIYTDSKYLKDGITKWIIKWEKNNWKNSKKQDVKNKDLWEKLKILIKLHEVSWSWVKAHSTISFNNLADKFAKEAIKS